MAEPSVISTPHNSNEWNLNMDFTQGGCINTSKTTATSSEFCLPATSTEFDDFWSSMGVMNLDYTLTGTPMFSQASNALLTVEATNDAGSQEEATESDKHINCIYSIAEISTKIFQPSGPSDHIAANNPPIDQPLPRADFYCETFSSSYSLVKTLVSYNNSVTAVETDSSGRTTVAVDDADFLLVLASYLKLINRYDLIFTSWLTLIEPEMQETFHQARSETIRSTILQVLPPNNVASILAPTCYVAQIRLVLEISQKMFQKLSSSLEGVANKITGELLSATRSSVGHISHTTLELIMGRERIVQSKKNKLMGLMENSSLRDRMEHHLSMLQGSDSL